MIVRRQEKRFANICQNILQQKIKQFWCINSGNFFCQFLWVFQFPEKFLAETSNNWMKWLKWNLSWSFQRKNFCALSCAFKILNNCVHTSRTLLILTIHNNSYLISCDERIHYNRAAPAEMGLPFTQNSNYSNSCCESSLMAWFVGILGILWHLIPDMFADVCEFSCKSCQVILLQRDVCWKPWILAQTFPWSFCDTIWKGIFKHFPLK